MADISSKLRVLSEFRRYFDDIPIVGHSEISLKDERCKMRIVAFIVARHNGLDEGKILVMMCEKRGLDSHIIPPLYLAVKNVGMTMDYLTDYNKIEMFYEHGAIVRFEKYLLEGVV